IYGNAWEYDTEVALSYDDSQWWVQWEPAAFAPGLEAGQRIGVDSRAPERAEILAGDDTPIITERAIRHYGLDKTKIGEDDLESAAEQVAESAGVDPESFTARVLAAGPEAFVEAISVRPEDADAWIEEGFEDLPGALVVSGEALLAPTRTFARELLGRAGEATADPTARSPRVTSSASPDSRRSTTPNCADATKWRSSPSTPPVARIPSIARKPSAQTSPPLRAGRPSL